MNENKVPCGGFRIGDGRAREGDTLKSLGGAYIKVVPDEESPESYKIADDSPLNYETAMKYDGIIFMLLVLNESKAVIPLLDIKLKRLEFAYYIIGDSLIQCVYIEVREDNSIHVITDNYTLTSAS